VSHSTAMASVSEEESVNVIEAQGLEDRLAQLEARLADQEVCSS
jgi:hypothetical protein